MGSKGGPPVDPALPSGSVTFVFTDIAGSTQLFQELGDAYLGVLQRHNELVRAAFGAHSGVEIKDEGDALFFVFRRAADALCACVDAQEALATEQWVHGDEVLVRMGVHTGDAVPVGADYIAIAVHQAARISAAAHGGQVVVSAAARETAGNADAGDTLTDLGVHVLKDFDEPVRLWQLEGPNAPRSFPPLRTRSLVLPAPRTTFIGRAVELDELIQRLRNPGLVTVTGPGGVGKTRLTLEAAGQLAATDLAGVHFVELTDQPDAHAVAAEIARQLGVVTRPDRSVLGGVIADVGVRRALLVLDNCERVVEGCATVVAALLDACPHVTVATTSRTPLEVDGEVVHRLRPLSTAGEERSTDALRLLLDRVAAATGQQVFEPDELAAATDICDRLDGLPLALELAAATTARVPLRTLAGQLDDRLDLLRARGRAPRQQTLRNVLDWSHGLLSGDAKRTFRRLAMLRGSFDAEVALAIASGPGDIAHRSVASSIAELVDQSMISVDAQTGRYSLLETMRVYAAEELDRSGERRAIEHAIIGWAETSVTVLDLDGNQVAEAARRVTANYPNLVTALETAFANGDHRLVGLCAVMGRYWHLRAMYSEGVRWLERTLSLGGEPSRERADAELRHARLLIALGELEAALVALRDPMSAIVRCGDAHQRREARLYEMSVLEQIDELDDAEVLGLALVDDAVAAGDGSVLTRCLNHLGIVALGRRDLVVSRARYDDALEAAIKNEMGREIPVMHLNLGEVLIELGDSAEALRHLLAAEQLAREQEALAMRIAALELLASLEENVERRAEIEEQIEACGSRIGPEVRTSIDRQMSSVSRPTDA